MNRDDIPVKKPAPKISISLILVLFQFIPFGFSCFIGSTLASEIERKSSYTATGDFDGNGVSDFVINKNQQGVWVFLNGSGEGVQISEKEPKSFALADLDGNKLDDIVVDFGLGTGLQGYLNNSTWKRLTPDGKNIIENYLTGDLDGNGKTEIIVQFDDGLGLWAYYNNTAWKRLDTPGTLIRSFSIQDMDENSQDDILAKYEEDVRLWAYMNNSDWESLGDHPSNDIPFGKKTTDEIVASSIRDKMGLFPQSHTPNCTNWELNGGRLAIRKGLNCLTGLGQINIRTDGGRCHICVRYLYSLKYPGDPIDSCASEFSDYKNFFKELAPPESGFQDFLREKIKESDVDCTFRETVYLVPREESSFEHVEVLKCFSDFMVKKLACEFERECLARSGSLGSPSCDSE